MAVSFRKPVSLVAIVAITLAALPSPVRAGGAVGVSTSVGAASEPLNSAVTGAAVGAMGGPVGFVIGASIGLLYGLWNKRQQEAQARAEVERQRAMDRELERQMAAQRPGGAPAGDGQGVVFVKDHLAVASLPPAAAPGAAAPRAAPTDADAEGFVPVRENGRVVRREHRASDGTVDVVLHYDVSGRVVRRDDSTRLDGRLDTSAFYVDGALQRKESDTDADGAPDVWAYYDGAGELTRFEALVAGGGRRVEHYRGGRVSERQEGGVLTVFDDRGRMVKQGRVGAGSRMLSWRFFEPNGNVARDEDFGEDGELSAVAHYEGGRLVRRELYEIDEAAFSRVPVVALGEAGP